MAKRKKPVGPWRNRIVGYGEESPEQLLANPFNFRIHTQKQEKALSGVLREVGFVQNVLVNRTTGHMLDGHLRAAMGITEGQPTIPVTYLELTEEEEKIILATFDPLSAMAVTDQDLLATLVGDLVVSDEAVKAMLDSIKVDQSEVGIFNGHTVGNMVRCPNCDKEFTL